MQFDYLTNLLNSHPPCCIYMKPSQFLAQTALHYKLDIKWWIENLDICSDILNDRKREDQQETKSLATAAVNSIDDDDDVQPNFKLLIV